MGGGGVSRARRVGCGAVLLPVSSVAVSSASVIWCVWAARRSRARSPAVLTSRTSPRAVPSFPLPTGSCPPSLPVCCHRRQTAASASVARARCPCGRNRRPSPLQVLRRPSVCRLFFAVCALA
jgi:hypothetical protein